MPYTVRIWLFWTNWDCRIFWLTKSQIIRNIKINRTRKRWKLLFCEKYLASRSKLKMDFVLKFLSCWKYLSEIVGKLTFVIQNVTTRWKHISKGEGEKTKEIENYHAANWDCHLFGRRISRIIRYLKINRIRNKIY